MPHPSVSPYEDEISLTELMIKLWRRRALIVILPLLAGLASLIFIFFQASQIRQPVEHFINLTAVQQGSYPNGTAFSVQDIVAPEVLAELARRTGFEQGDRLRDAISVSMGAPNADGILHKYQTMLDRRGLNQTQIDAINAALSEELTQATGNTVRIAVDYKSLQLDSDAGKQLAILLPQSWAEIYARQFRVLDNTQLQGLAVIAALPLSSGLGALEAERILRNLSEGLQMMAEDSRLQSLQTSDRITPADLRRRIADFREVYMPAILSRNMSQSDAMTAFYLSDLALQIDQMDDQLNGLNETIQELKDILDSQKSGSVSGGAGLSGSRGADQLQLGGDAIGEIVTLVNKSTLSSYLTELFDEQRQLVAARAELRSQVKRVTAASPFPEDILATSQAQLDQIITAYNELLQAARQMNRRNISIFHEDLGGPVVTGQRYSPQTRLILAMSVLLGGFIALVLALLIPEGHSLMAKPRMAKTASRPAAGRRKGQGKLKIELK